MQTDVFVAQESLALTEIEGLFCLCLFRPAMTSTLTRLRQQPSEHPIHSQKPSCLASRRSFNQSCLLRPSTRPCGHAILLFAQVNAPQFVLHTGNRLLIAHEDAAGDVAHHPVHALHQALASHGRARVDLPVALGEDRVAQVQSLSHLSS